MQKRIGIVASQIGECFGIPIEYAHFLSRYGKVVPLMPSEDIDDSIDLLILPGGRDLNPLSYGCVPGFKTGVTDVFKQYFYDVNLSQYINNGTPVFGICLGFQQLAVYFGNKLVQELETYPYSTPRNAEVESLQVNIDVLSQRFGQQITKSGYNLKQKTKVNSLHHQGLYYLLNDNLQCIAVSEYKNIECFVHKTLNIAGVQWHPEELNGDWISNTIIKSFLNNEN